MAFQNIDNNLKYIGSKGNYVDIMNTLVLLYAYSKVYTTGHVPMVKMIRGGAQASAVANLQSQLTGATSQTNSIHEFILIRKAFIDYVAATQPGVYKAIDAGQYARMGIVVGPVLPLEVQDCQGSAYATATTPAEYTSIWNNYKVPGDKAICGTRLDYLIWTGFGNYYIKSGIPVDAAGIAYNAPGVVAHTDLDVASKEREEIVNRETRINPKSVSIYSKN